MTFQQMFQWIRDVMKDPGGGVNQYVSDSHLVRTFNHLQRRLALVLPYELLRGLHTTLTYDYSSQITEDTYAMTYDVGRFQLPTNFLRLVKARVEREAVDGKNIVQVDLLEWPKFEAMLFWGRPTRLNPVASVGWRAANVSPTGMWLYLAPALPPEDPSPLLVVDIVANPTEATNVSDTTECEFAEPVEDALVYLTAGYIRTEQFPEEYEVGFSIFQRGLQMLQEYAQALRVDWEDWLTLIEQWVAERSSKRGRSRRGS